jgi:putative transposase
MILPDHLHLFCSPATQEITPIKKWVQFWKALAARDWPYPHEQPIWQVDAWDTQLRREDNYSAKWHYVSHNPVRHGLTDQAESWPFQGELNILPWHDQ